MTTTTDKPKRVRLTDTRLKRWMQFQQTIAATWARAVREQRPLQATFSELSNAIHTLDVTNECKRDLGARNWGARDLVISLHAEWCLYLDGVRRTFDEIATFADEAYKAALPHGKGPADEARLAVMHRICGRHEYRGTGKPFFDDAEPKLLSAREDK